MAVSVHPTAVVDSSAYLGCDAEVGAYCVVGSGVRLGDGVRLMSHVVVDGSTTIGDRCTVFPFASLGTQTQDLKYRGAHTSVRIGCDTTIRECVTVNSGTAEGDVTRVGSGCHIMAYAHVAHACDVGDSVVLANGATLAGEVCIETQAVLGALSMVHQFCRVGRLCMVGAGTKLVQDCPPYMLVDGHPASVRGVNTVGCRRRGVDSGTRMAIARAYKVIYRSGLSRRQAIASLRASGESRSEIDEIIDFIEASQRGIV